MHTITLCRLGVLSSAVSRVGAAGLLASIPRNLSWGIWNTVRACVRGGQSPGNNLWTWTHARGCRDFYSRQAIHRAFREGCPEPGWTRLTQL